MKKVGLFFVMLFLLINLPPAKTYSATYTILMNDGGKVEAASYVLEGENINVLLREPQGSVIAIPRSNVHKIIKNKEDKNNKSKIKAEDKSLGLCDAIYTRCDLVYCCHKLDLLIEEMKPVCASAEITTKPRFKHDIENRKSDEIRCKDYKNKISIMENNCPDCYLVKTCCKGNR